MMRELSFFGWTTPLIIFRVRVLPLSRESSSFSCKRADNSSYLSHTRSVCTHPPSLALQPTRAHTHTHRARHPKVNQLCTKTSAHGTLVLCMLTLCLYRNNSVIQHADIHWNCRKKKTLISKERWQGAAGSEQCVCRVQNEHFKQ